MYKYCIPCGSIKFPYTKFEIKNVVFRTKQKFAICVILYLRTVFGQWMKFMTQIRFEDLAVSRNLALSCRNSQKLCVWHWSEVPYSPTSTLLIMSLDIFSLAVLRPIGDKERCIFFQDVEANMWHLPSRLPRSTSSKFFIY
jgi:hypothetical protein